MNYEHADVNAADEDGNTAVHYAHAGGWVHIVRYFAQHNGDLEKPNNAGQWPYDVYEEMAKDDEILSDLHHEMQMVHYNHFVRDMKGGRKPNVGARVPVISSSSGTAEGTRTADWEPTHRLAQAFSPRTASR